MIEEVKPGLRRAHPSSEGYRVRKRKSHSTPESGRVPGPPRYRCAALRGTRILVDDRFSLVGPDGQRWLVEPLV